MNNIELVNTIYGSFYGFQGDLITKRLKTIGAYERNDLAMALSFLEEGDIVLDVGGNIGTFAIPAALKVGETGKVYSFEGNPKTYSVLSQNITINNLGNRIEAIQAIVTNRHGSYILIDPPPGNMGGCHFQIDSRKPDHVNAIENFTSIGLDDWFKNVDKNKKVNFIKIDVEGADLSVLESAKEIIRNSSPIIFVEVNKEALSRYNHSEKDLEEFIVSFDYHLFRNIGQVNSGTDEYVIGRLFNLAQNYLEAKHHYNILAVHSQDGRYPKIYKRGLYTTLYILVKQLKRVIRDRIKFKIF